MYRRVQACWRLRHHSHLQCNMWRQASRDGHQYQENECVLARKSKAVRENVYRGKHHYSPQTLNERAPERHRHVAPILRVSARAIPDVLCVLGHFWRSFFEASCLLEIDTAETSDGTVTPLAAELASTTVPCTARSRHPSRSFVIVMFRASFVLFTTSLKFHRCPSCLARLLRPDAWEVCKWTETDFATFQDETTFHAREQFMGSFVAGCGWPRVIPLRKTTSPCSLVTNPDVELFFFFEECSFSFFAQDTSSVALPHPPAVH